jgi:uncharacterized membrane protein HdeD (DUF308 family)
MDKNLLIALGLTRAIMGILCFTSIILAGAENPDGSVNFGWTLLWIGVALVAANFFKHLDEKANTNEKEGEK